MTILLTPQPNNSLVDIKTVCATLCRSRASIYRDIQRGDFPKPIKLGGSSRWRRDHRLRTQPNQKSRNYNDTHHQFNQS